MRFYGFLTGSSRNKIKITLFFGMILFFTGTVLAPNPAAAQIPKEYQKKFAEMRPKIDKNIEKYRKGNFHLVLVDEKGKPFSNAAIDVRQQSHSFKFGCNILVLGQKKRKNQLYEEEFLRLFNLATTTFCCSVYHPSPDQFLFGEKDQDIWRRPQPDRVLAFCQKHGIEMKGQPLIAGSWHPKWMPADREEAKKEYRKWMKAVADHYQNRVGIYDVVNEAYLHKSPSFSLYEKNLDYVSWAFQEAQKLFPKDVLLEINEATSEAHNPNLYLKLLKKMRSEGAEFDSIGFQFHLFTKASFQGHLNGHYLSMESLPGIYRQYCELNVPMFITEITVPSTLGKTLSEGEAIQATVLDHLYRLWFSIPNMAGIVYWNLCDGAAWKSEGKVQAGLLDGEMREKPAYQALYQLIRREWNTQLQVKSSAKGEIDFRGFYGKYLFLSSDGNKTKIGEFDLSKEGSVRVIMKESE